MNNFYQFSGHEKFHCRHFWLKKGYDFVRSGNKFTADDAVVHLGVGKNMVASIRYWMKAFNILSRDEQPTEFAHFLFGDNGVDPYLENHNTMWLLHYLIVTNRYASIYNLIFNGLLKERFEFNREHIITYIGKKCKEKDIQINLNTLKEDISVFIRNYYRPKKHSKNIEDEFSGILIDLDILQNINRVSGQFWFRMERIERKDFPYQLVLFAILDQHPDEVSIPFYKLVNETIGNIFALNESAILELINQFMNYNSDIIFTDDAGVRELQFRRKFDKWDILKNYYVS